MHDTAQRWVPRPNLVENSRKRSRIGDVASMDADVGTKAAQFGNAILGSGRRSAAPAASPSVSRRKASSALPSWVPMPATQAATVSRRWSFALASPDGVRVLPAAR